MFTKANSAQPYICRLFAASGNCCKAITEITIKADTSLVERFREAHSERLCELGLGSNATLTDAGKLKFSTDSTNEKHIREIVDGFNASEKVESLLRVDFEIKNGKKDRAIPLSAQLSSVDQSFQECLTLARQCVADLQSGDTSGEEAQQVFLRYRDQLPDGIAESFDALCALHISQQNDNPLFVRRGRPGDKVNADIFLNFWDYFSIFRKNAPAFVSASLFGGRIVGDGINKSDKQGKGTLFFSRRDQELQPGTRLGHRGLSVLPARLSAGRRRGAGDARGDIEDTRRSGTVPCRIPVRVRRNGDDDG